MHRYLLLDVADSAAPSFNTWLRPGSVDSDLSILTPSKCRTFNVKFCTLKLTQGATKFILLVKRPKNSIQNATLLGKGYYKNLFARKLAEIQGLYLNFLSAKKMATYLKASLGLATLGTSPVLVMNPNELQNFARLFKRSRIGRAIRLCDRLYW